jgi:hypothetical protein
MVAVRRGPLEPIDKQGAIIRFKVPLLGTRSAAWVAALRQCIDLDHEFFAYRVRVHPDSLAFECEEANVESGVTKIDTALAYANKAASEAEEEHKRTREAAKVVAEDKRRELERLKSKFKDA